MLSVKCQAMVLFLSCVSACCGNRSALSVGLLFAEHMPDDSRKFSHHRDSGDRASASAFDPFVPLSQASILSQRLVSDLCQQPPGHVTASLGDSSESLIVFTAIATAGCEPPIVG